MTLATSLDSIGIAGFSHEFHALEGQRSVVSDVFDAFNNAKMSAVGLVVFLLSIVFPVLSNLPTERTQLFRSQNRACGIMAEELLERTKRDGAGDMSSGDRSAMALLRQCRSLKWERVLNCNCSESREGVVGTAPVAGGGRVTGDYPCSVSTLLSNSSPKPPHRLSSSCSPATKPPPVCPHPFLRPSVLIFSPVSLTVSFTLSSPLSVAQSFHSGP